MHGTNTFILRSHIAIVIWPLIKACISMLPNVPTRSRASDVTSNVDAPADTHAA